tara:strand:+ start:919 stop:1065 length:147 start_codon:yes stop_codon:yes gene_type:complete
MGKTKELMELEWFTESQRAELHWMEQEYLHYKKNERRKNKTPRQKPLG